MSTVRPELNGNSNSEKIHRPSETVVLATSLLGFLEAMPRLVHSFAPRKRLQLVKRVQAVLTEDFMVAVEGALSSLRHHEYNTRLDREQKYLANKYAKSGRPLGAMLLQQAFMTLLVSCGSLQLTTATKLQHASILDYLMPVAHPEINASSGENHDMVATLAAIAAESIRVLDDGHDYLELSSAWQQHLALKVRGQALTTFLTCVLADEDTADADILMSWLDSTMSDEAQMADTNLASVVFKCLAILARTSSAFATSLSRLLPRYIVRRGAAPESVDVAAKCFASILQGLSQDAVITSLYSLGNVLTSRNAEKAAITTGYTNGTSATKSSTVYTQHPTSSAISFEAGGEEESMDIYANVVRAIITITLQCKDETVIPLTQSMLLQKLRKVNSAVDALILVETAALGAVGEQAELKSLLKLYDRIGEDGVARKDYNLLEAVCAFFFDTNVSLLTVNQGTQSAHQVGMLHPKGFSFLPIIHVAYLRNHYQ
jgi:phosphatidylinositol 4-kinase